MTLVAEDTGSKPMHCNVVADVKVGVEEGLTLIWRQIGNVRSGLRVSLFTVCSGSLFGNALNPRVYCAFDCVSLPF